MDLTKVFDKINHPLLLAELHVYGFSKQALAIICRYLSNRKQRIKINNVFSSWKDLFHIRGASRISPWTFAFQHSLEWFILLLKRCRHIWLCWWYHCIYFWPKFRECSEITWKNSMLAIRWFENNYMKLSTDKCHLIVSGYKHEQVWWI